MSLATHTADIRSLDAWTEIVHALPTPAALVDREGCIVTASKWIDLEEGERLVLMGEEPNGITIGTNSDTRWRIELVRENERIYLATIERFSSGDHMLRRFFSATDELYVVYDQYGRAIERNSAWQRVLGYSDEEMIGLNSWSLLHPDALALRSGVEEELSAGGRAEPSWPMRAVDGTYRSIQWKLLFDPSVGRCFGIGRDVSEDSRAKDELQRRAYTDDLTGLASRSRTVAELDRHLRNSGNPALLFCDLDQFKVVNDSLGHAVGDRLLASLGERLSKRLNGPDIMVGRLGGDEFAVVIADGTLAEAEAAAELAFDAVSQSFTLVGRSVKIGMSIGICVANKNEPQSAAMMFERADMAVYQAKEQGRNRTVVFGPELQERVDRRFELETALREGLEKGEFEPWFQPVMSIHTGGIVGVEALLRWNRGQDDIASPSSFLDVAMETGLITQIGRQMIDRALTEFGGIGGALTKDIWMTLNVSARELMDEGFTEWFVNRVGSAGLRPSQIVIEITESVAIEEHALSDQLTVMRALGFRIALDDFGTGHSSLAHLRTLPIDMVKIDRSFVADLVEDATTRALTRSVVDLCQALGLSVIFEGVETKAESIAVVQAGGEFAQGFLHARPMPVADLQWRTVGAALARRLGARQQIDPTK